MDSAETEQSPMMRKDEDDNKSRNRDNAGA